MHTTYTYGHVGSYLATKIYRQFTGYAWERGRSPLSRPMMKGQLPTNQLHDINWGALDHASLTMHLVHPN